MHTKKRTRKVRVKTNSREFASRIY